MTFVSDCTAAEVAFAAGEPSAALAAYLNRCRRLHDHAAAALARARTGQLMIATPGVDPASAADLGVLRRVIAEMASLLPLHGGSADQG